MFERFTDRARRVLVIANDEARELGSPDIGTAHILLGLVVEGEGLGARALKALGVSREAVVVGVEALGQGSPSASADTQIGPNRPFTVHAKKTLEFALREALMLGHSYIGTEHLLLGLIRQDNGEASQILLDIGLTLVQVRDTIISLISGAVRTETSRFSEALGADEAIPVSALSIYRLRQRIVRLEDHTARLKKALLVLAEGDSSWAMALRKAVEELQPEEE